VDHPDREPPRLAEAARLVPAQGTRDTSFSLGFRVTEPLAGDPEVHADLGTRSAPLVLDEAATERMLGVYAYAYRATGTEPEGEVRVSASLLDRVGNLAPDVALGTFRLDFTPPAVADVAFGSALASSGTVLALDLTFDEPLAEAPRVEMVLRGQQEPSLAWRLGAGDGRRFSFSYAPTGAESPGPYEVAVAGRDAAGNQLGPTDVGEVGLDFDAPAVVWSDCEPRRAAPGGVVRVVVRLDEAPAAPPRLVAVAGDGAELAFELADGWGELLAFRHVVLAGEAGGYQLRLLDVRDAAGNRAGPLPLGELVADETPPRVLDWFQRPPGRGRGGVYNASDTLVVGFSTDEPLGEPPRVSLGAVPVPCETSAGQEVACELALAETRLFSRLPIRARLVDEVGNAQEVDVSHADVDSLLPSLVAVELEPRVARLGTIVRLSILASEPLGSPPELRWLPGESPPGFVFEGVGGLNYTFQLAVASATAAGEHRLTAVSMADLAGNEETYDVAPADGVLEVDNVPPAVSELQTNAEAYSRQAGFDQVVVTCLVSESLDHAGARLEARFGAEGMDCGPYEEPPGRYTCLHTVGEQAEEGPVAVTILAADAAGNTDHAGTTVRVDLTPPSVAQDTISVQLEPAPGNPVPWIEAVTQGTRVRVSFSVDELLLDDPEVVSTVNGIVFESEVRSGTHFVFGHTLAAADLLQGEERLTLSMRDRVGNSVRQELVDAGFVVDTGPPSAPATGEAGKVVLRRGPWGDAQQPARVVLGLTGSPGATEGTGTLLVFDASGPVRSELGRVGTGPGGGFPWLDLRPPDRREVFVAFADRAGNTSPVVRVRDVEWVASMGLERPGEDQPNPHSFSSLPIWYPHLDVGEDGGAWEPETGPVLRPADGSEVRTSGGRAWRREQAGRRQALVEIGRSGPGLAYDSARGRLVLFGGQASLRLADTWEWDGRDWLRLDPPHAPPARSGHRLAYDSRRGRILSFGGHGPSDRLGDLWEWDGFDWSARPTDPAPAPRAGHALAFDRLRGRLVLFGGSGDEDRGDTWEWDGDRWYELDPPLAPSPRRSHAMTFDSQRGRTVLFGGGSRGALDDTWEWDGRVWTAMADGPAPPARGSPALAFDERRGRAVLFGGNDGSIQFGDTWEWDGERWWERETDVGPAPRYSHALAWDSGRGRVVLVGGRSDGVLADQWEWDGDRWLRLFPAGLPVPRSQPAMAYDGVGERMLLFGGLGALGHRRETLTWDGRRWWPLAVEPQPDVDSCVAAHDSSRSRVVLVGRARTGASETWEFDGESWVHADSAVEPPWRFGSALAFDEAGSRTVLFGGSFGDERLGDTWEWDGEAWRRADAAESPSPRDGAGMAFSGARGRLLLFGGDDGEFKDDLWEWDGQTWTRLPTEGGPAARAHAALVGVPARGTVLLYGGKAAAATLADTWEYDGRTWRNVDMWLHPPHRGHAGIGYDRRRRRVVLFGGSGINVALGDTWEWDDGVWREAGGDTGPSARVGSALAFDPASGATLLLGGHDGGDMRPDPWLWDGRIWHLVLTDSPPPRRMGHVLVADPIREALLVHGGWGGAGRLGDTWTQDGEDWRRLDPQPAPAPRDAHAAALDTARGRVVLFGGTGFDGGYLGDTWEWDGESWEHLEPPSGPGPRFNHAMAYHADRRRSLLFGGNTRDGRAAETWEWDGEGWEQRFPDPRPPARSRHALAFDTVRRSVVLFGGRGDHGHLDDTWEWDGEVWRELDPEVRPPPRRNHAVAYDEATASVVLFGGDHDDTLLGDTWTLPSSTEDRPGHHFAVDVRSALHAPDVELVSLRASFHAGGTGMAAGAPLSGVDLLAWSSVRGRWMTVASSDAGVTADDPPARLEWTTDSPAEIDSLLFRDHLHLAVTPVGANGTRRAELATDYVELLLRYRLP